MITKNELKELKSKINILDFCTAYGIPFKRHGHNYQLVNHDSCIISAGNSAKGIPDWQTFFWNSKGLSGDIIVFVQNVYPEETGGKPITFPQVIYLLENAVKGDISQFKASYQPSGITSSIGGKMAYDGPKPGPSNTHLIKYLSDERKIKKELVEELIKKGKIFEDDHYNIIFKIFDNTGNWVGHEQRGSFAETSKKYSKCLPGSTVCKFGFSLGNKNDNIYFFESAIDLISFYQEHKMIASKGLLVSLAGCNSNLIEAYHERYPNSTINICTDWNQDQASNKLINKLTDMGIKFNDYRPVPMKDWNEILKSKSVQNQDGK